MVDSDDGDGCVIVDDHDAMKQQLAREWEHIFLHKSVDDTAIQELFAHIPPSAWDWGLMKSVTPRTILETLGRAKHNKTGPDGLGASAWLAGGSFASELLFDVYLQMSSEGSPPGVLMTFVKFLFPRKTLFVLTMVLLANLLKLVPSASKIAMLRQFRLLFHFRSLLLFGMGLIHRKGGLLMGAALL